MFYKKRFTFIGCFNSTNIFALMNIFNCQFSNYNILIWLSLTFIHFGFLKKSDCSGISKNPDIIFLLKYTHQKKIDKGIKIIILK